jgi:hypothetical protein
VNHVSFAVSAEAVTKALPDTIAKVDGPNRWMMAHMTGYALHISAATPQELMDLADKIAIIAERWEAE